MSFDKELNGELLKNREANMDKIILSNEGLLYVQLNKFGLAYDDDAKSYGYEALFNAARSFDAAKNNAFSTYASVCIYNRLGDYVRRIKTIKTTNTISYDNSSGEDLTFLDTLESSDTADGPCLCEAGVKMILDAFDMCLSCVTNKMHKEIITIWYDSHFTKTHEEIAKQLNCSQSYVSQAIGQFRKKLKLKLEVLK